MLRRNLRSNWARRNEDEDNQRSPHFGGRNRRNAFHDDQNRDYYGRENSPTEWRRTGNQGNGPDNNFMRQLNTENHPRIFDSPLNSHLPYSPYGNYSHASPYFNDYPMASYSPLPVYNFGRHQVNPESSENFQVQNFGQTQNVQSVSSPFNTPNQSMSINNQSNASVVQNSQNLITQDTLIQSSTPEMSQARTIPSIMQSPGPQINVPAGNVIINRNTANIPPITQFASPSVVLQNPFSVGHLMGNSPAAPTLGSQTILQNGSNSVTQQVPTTNHSVMQGQLTDSQKSKIHIYNERKKDFDQKFNNMVKLRKTDYPMLPENAEIEYMPWRTKFLMQAQVHQMHEIYEPNYVPMYKLFEMPPNDDPSFEGREEIVGAAHDMYNAIIKYENQKFIFQGTAIAHAIEKHKTARLFVKPNSVNPMQIFKDLDATFIQHNKVTKGECISVVWNLKLQPGERLAAFFARLDIECLNLSYMFNYKLSDEDRLAIIQHNIPNEYMQTYMSLLQQDKGIEDIKQSLIALEVASLRREDQVHSVRDFVRKSYDNKNGNRNYNRNSSPHGSHTRHSNYEERRSASPGQFRDRSRNWKDQRPYMDTDTKYLENNSSQNNSYSKGNGSYSRGQREKSRSRSPTSGNGNYDKRSNDDNRNYDYRRHEQNRSKHSPGSSSDNRRQYRSPSPGGNGRHPSKKVNFRSNIAQDVDNQQQDNSNDDNDSGIDPDLRYNKSRKENDSDEDTQNAMAAWNMNKVMGSANIAIAHRGKGTIVGSSHLTMGGTKMPKAEVNMKVTLAEIIDWRRRFPIESEWMRSSHITHIIRRERVEAATDKIKHQITLNSRSEKRQANRIIARIESDIGNKCIGAEKPQERPFAYETAAQNAHKEVIRIHMANKPADTPSTKKSRDEFDEAEEASIIRSDKRARRAAAAELRMSVTPNQDTLSLLSLASTHNPNMYDNTLNVTGTEEPVIVGSVNMVTEVPNEEVEGESKEDRDSVEDHTEYIREILPTELINFDVAREQAMSRQVANDHYLNQIIPCVLPRVQKHAVPIEKVTRKFNIDEFRNELCTVPLKEFVDKDYTAIMYQYPINVTIGPENRRRQINTPKEHWEHICVTALDNQPSCFSEITDTYTRMVIVMEWHNAKLQEEQYKHPFWFIKDVNYQGDDESVPSLQSPTSSDNEGPLLPHGPIVPAGQERDSDLESLSSDDTVLSRDVDEVSVRSDESLTSFNLSQTQDSALIQLNKAMK